MNPISPRLPELLRARHRQVEFQIEKETAWTYVYRVGSKSGFKISKFADDSFEVPASVLGQRWPSMKANERLEFGFNWSTKRAWNDNDAKILEIIMRDGDDHVWDIAHLHLPDTLIAIVPSIS